MSPDDKHFHSTFTVVSQTIAIGCLLPSISVSPLLFSSLSVPHEVSMNGWCLNSKRRWLKTKEKSKNDFGCDWNTHEERDGGLVDDLLARLLANFNFRRVLLNFHPGLDENAGNESLDLPSVDHSALSFVEDFLEEIFFDGRMKIVAEMAPKSTKILAVSIRLTLEHSDRSCRCWSRSHCRRSCAPKRELIYSSCWSLF